MPKKEEIFDFIKPTDNTQLLDYKGKDLQDFIYYLNRYYLTLRDSLNLDSSTTFGMELEFETALKLLINLDLLVTGLHPRWRIHHDGSLGMTGGEIATPILKDTKEDWDTLKKVCRIVSHHATILAFAGGHIHVGAQIFDNDGKSFRNFLKLWAVYENIIFRFTYGNYLTGREGIPKYAFSMADTFLDRVKEYDRDNLDADFLLRTINIRKYQAVNFCHVKFLGEEMNGNTIEFRCPNGTLDPVIWQNNLNLLVKLIEYAKSDKYDDDIVSKRYMERYKLPHYFSDYNQIYLNQAIELGDIIFDNNLDKVYFLRQYLKNYQTSNEILKKSKRFTKAFK